MFQSSLHYVAVTHMVVGILHDATQAADLSNQQLAADESMSQYKCTAWFVVISEHNPARLQVLFGSSRLLTSFHKLPLHFTALQGLPGTLQAQVLLWKLLTFPSCSWTM